MVEEMGGLGVKFDERVDEWSEDVGEDVVIFEDQR